MLKYLVIGENKIGFTSTDRYLPSWIKIFNIKEEEGTTKIVVQRFKYTIEFPITKEALALLITTVRFEKNKYAAAFIEALLPFIESLQFKINNTDVKIQSTMYSKKNVEEIQKMSDSLLNLLMRILEERANLPCDSVILNTEEKVIELADQSKNIVFLAKKNGKITIARPSEFNPIFYAVDEITENTFEKILELLKLSNFLHTLKSSEAPDKKSVKDKILSIYTKLLIPNQIDIDFNRLFEMLKFDVLVEPYKILKAGKKINPRHVYIDREFILNKLISDEILEKQSRIPTIRTSKLKLKPKWDQFAATKIIKTKFRDYDVLAFVPKTHQTPAEVIDGMLNVIEFFYQNTSGGNKC